FVSNGAAAADQSEIMDLRKVPVCLPTG
ncbi:hypothetical protein AVEN_197995-2-1, partial [Araneus ventricosus]